MTEASLKPGWTKVKFGEVVRLCKDRSSDPEADGIERYVGLEHLEPEDLRIRSWGLVSDGTTFTSRFKPGQVLFGKRRAYQRKVAVADFEGVCSGDIYIFESADPKLLSPDLLPFICQTDRFFEYAVGTSAGSLSPRTNWRSLKDFPFDLPPLEEQEKFIRLLKSIEILIANTLSAKQYLRTVRNSLEKQLLISDSKQKFSTVKSLIQEGTVSLQTGPFGTVLKASSYTEEGYPLINPSDINDGEISFDKCKFIGEKDWNRLGKYQLHPADLVIGRKGDMRNMVFVTPNYGPMLLGSDCIRFRIHDENLHPEYLFSVLRSDVVQQWLQNQAYGTVMPGINEKILAKLEFFMPSIEEQTKISEKFTSINSGMVAFSDTISRNIALKKNILKKLIPSNAGHQAVA